MESTCNLELLRKGAPFTWGQQRVFRGVNEYTILEYHPHLYRDGQCTYELDEGTLLYYGWLDGKATGRSWESWDAALVGLIAYKHEGPNHKADRYFMKMIKEEI